MAVVNLARYGLVLEQPVDAASTIAKLPRRKIRRFNLNQLLTSLLFDKMILPVISRQPGSPICL